MLLRNKLSDPFRIRDIKKINNTTKAYIEMGETGTINQLLTNIVDSVEILGLTELLPSMNEIFIKVVNESNLTTAGEKQAAEAARL
jgi:hypothetical protein